MTLITKALVPIAIGATLAAGFATASIGQTAQGYYTADQAARGAALFDANCSQCHGKNLEGVEAPGLVGADVMGNWATAQGMYDYFSVAMPPTAPGKLDKQSYVDIMAHILEVNGAPAGAAELTAADLPNVDLVAATKGAAPVTSSSAASEPPNASSSEEPGVPQAFTFGKDLPTVSSSEEPSSSSAPAVPQAFTFGKDLPTVSSSAAPK